MKASTCKKMGEAMWGLIVVSGTLFVLLNLDTVIPFVRLALTLEPLE